MAENETPKPGTGTPFPDIAGILGQLKIPGVDVNAIVESGRKDIEALTQANRQAYESMQALARREAEMLSQTVTELQSALAGLAGQPAEAASKGSALAKQAVAKTLASMLDVAESASKAQAQAYETLNKRFQERLEELRKLIPPK
jgi:phasin family protein